MAAYNKMFPLNISRLPPKPGDINHVLKELFEPERNRIAHQRGSSIVNKCYEFEFTPGDTINVPVIGEFDTAFLQAHI